MGTGNAESSIKLNNLHGNRRLRYGILRHCLWSTCRTKLMNRFLAVIILFSTFVAYGLEERILGNSSAFHRELTPILTEELKAPEEKEASKPVEKTENERTLSKELTELSPQKDFVEAFNKQWNEAKPPSEPILAPHVQRQRRPTKFQYNAPALDQRTSASSEELSRDEVDGSLLIR